MINNMDILAFFISMIIAVVVTIWIASGNNKVENYGVGENDPPETSPPPLPGTRTRIFDCSPPEGSTPPEPKNQYGIPQIPKKVPMPEVKPLKEECLYCREEDIFHNDEHDFQGDDGIMFNHKNGIFYLVLEHFRGEINMVEIKNCPKCGRRL